MPTPLSFNVNWYVQQSPDVAVAIASAISPNAFEHFQTYGRYEARSASPLFDARSYLAQNADVASAVVQEQTTAWDHFVRFGAAEGRSPTPLLNETFYLQHNPDVAQAIEQGLISSAAQHFVLFGYSERRAINPVIDLDKYLAVNPDVANAVANGLVSPFEHLLQYGLSEGRDLGNGVDLSYFSRDPVFIAALSQGDTTAALQRVEAVAPFIQTFERPAGWTLPADLAIPVDFVLSAVSSLKLIIPVGLIVPSGLLIPEDVFELVAPVPKPDPAPECTPEPTPEPEPSAFAVTKDENNVVSFSYAGSALSVTESGGVWTFTTHGGGRSGSDTQTGYIAGMDVPAGTTLSISSALAGSQSFTGEGTAWVVASVTGENLATTLAAQGVGVIQLAAGQQYTLTPEQVVLARVYDSAVPATLGAVGDFTKAGEVILTGTDGNDTIDASLLTFNSNLVIEGLAGDDTITGSSSGDTLTGGEGADTMNGGDGDDTLKFASNSELADDISVAGGSGIDTIEFTTAIDPLNLGNFNADMERVTGVERVQLFGASALNLGIEVQNAGVTTVLTGTGNTTLRYDDSSVGNYAVDATLLAHDATLQLTQFGGLGAGNGFVVTQLKGSLNATGFKGYVSVTAASGTGFNVTMTTGSGNDVITS